MGALITAAATAVKGASLGTVLQGAGTVLGVVGQMQAAKSQQAVAEYNARQQERLGKQELAQATLRAQRAQREKEMQISRARTVGAAGGGGQDYTLLGGLEEEGFYNERLAIWEGEEARKGRFAQAAGTRAEGAARAQASRYKAIGTVLDAAPSFYEAYA